MCACLCTGTCTGVWRLGYLGAVPRQNLPLAAGQCDLLLDGAFNSSGRIGKEVKGAREAATQTLAHKWTCGKAQAAGGQAGGSLGPRHGMQA